MFDALRLLTVHPALVHLPIGILVLAAVLYVLAAARRSERWTFAADASLAFGAASALIAGAFGLASYFALEWPGGLGPWPVIHLGFGVATAVLSTGLAAWRLWRRRKVQLVSWGSALAASALALVTIFTGYVGGEILVFHGGVAVEGAAHGALAPSMSWPDGEPKNMHDAMYRLRGAWARAVTNASRALVERPTPQRFEEVREAAGHMSQVAQWLASRDGGENGPSGPGVGGGGAGGGHGEHAAHGEHAHGGKGGVAQMGKKLLHHTQALQQAASSNDIAAVMQEVGQVSQTCANCHQQFRWNEGQ